MEFIEEHFLHGKSEQPEEEPSIAEENTKKYHGIELAAEKLVAECQLCQVSIEISIDELIPKTVKCNMCKEDTPVIRPPPGYEYIRCECNCLLLAEERPTEIRCTKPECRKIIRQCQTCCRRCAYPFHFYSRDIKHCSHCSKFSKFFIAILEILFNAVAALLFLYLCFAISFKFLSIETPSSHYAKRVTIEEILTGYTIVWSTVILTAMKYFLALSVGGLARGLLDKLDRPFTIADFKKKLAERVSGLIYRDPL